MANQQTAWSLNDLFPGLNSPQLEQAFQSLESQVADFEKVRPELKADMDLERFMEIMSLSEQTTRQAQKLYGFAELAFAADTQDQAIQALVARIQQFMAELENRTLFFNLWWKDLDDNAPNAFWTYPAITATTSRKSVTLNPTPSASRRKRSST